MKQLDQAPPMHFDLDAIGLEVDAGNQRHQHGADVVRRHGWKLFGNLATTRDQELLAIAFGMLFTDGIKDSP